MTATPRFIIASYGRTATHWMARALNAHPDILCTHGPFTTRQGIPDAGGIDDRVSIDANAAVAGFRQGSPSRRLEEIARLGPATVHGNVHGYSATSFTALCATPEDRDIRLVNIVRHPVPRIQSIANRLRRESAVNPNVAATVQEAREVTITPGFAAALETRYGIDLAQEEPSCFLVALAQVALCDHSDLGVDCPHLAMERVTSDAKAFRSLVERITDGSVAVPPEFVRKALEGGATNASEKRVSPRDRFDAWEPWKRYAFGVLHEAFDFSGLYARFDYDLSFRPVVPAGDPWRNAGAPTPAEWPYPILIEENHRGFNLVFWRGRYLAIRMSRGPLDLTRLPPAALDRMIAEGDCVSRPTREALASGIAATCP